MIRANRFARIALRIARATKLLTKNYSERSIFLGGRFGSFSFFLRRGGEGESEAPGRGGGRGAWRVSVASWGGGIFFRGRNSHQILKNYTFHT